MEELNSASYRGETNNVKQDYIIKGVANGDQKTLTVAAYREMKQKKPGWYLKVLYRIDIPESYSRLFNAVDTGNVHVRIIKHPSSRNPHLQSTKSEYYFSHFSHFIYKHCIQIYDVWGA